MSNPFDSIFGENEEVFQEEPFSPEYFIEKLARPNADNVILGQNGSDFDPEPLRKKLISKLAELELQFQNKTKQVNKIQETNMKKQENFKRKTKELDSHFSDVDSQYHDLDKVINFVSTKVVHLGDQLKQMDGKRARTLEAKELINYINEAQKTGNISSEIFTDPDKIHEAAAVLNKIHLVTLDLPEKEGKDFSKLNAVFQTITNRLEAELQTEFEKSLHFYNEQNHIEKMQQCAATLNTPCFNAYKSIVNNFIAIRLKSPFYTEDTFVEVKKCIDETSLIVTQVFPDRDQIMTRFIREMFDKQVYQKVKISLDAECFSHPEKYQPSKLKHNLITLADLYSRAMKLASEDLAKYDNDISFANDLKKKVFSSYLTNYRKAELEYLTKSSQEILEEFYSLINHDKKEQADAIQMHIKNVKSRLHNFRENMSASGTNLHEQAEMPNGQLLSFNVTTSLLEIHSRAVDRCVLLAEAKDRSIILREIAVSLLNNFVKDHLEYAIDFYTAHRPPVDSRNEPVIGDFLTTVGNASVTYHTLEKCFNDTILPSIASSEVQSEVRKIRQTEMRRVEEKISLEINHCINSIVNWIKILLKNKQEKDDFMCDGCLQKPTAACNEVCRFIVTNVLGTMNGPIDGENLQHVMMELGVRFHGALLDHLMGYQYNVVGAMQLIQDLHKYTATVKRFKDPFVDELFEGLNKLCNLLVVDPEQLIEFWNLGSLAHIEHGFLVQFVKLRADYRRNNIQSKLPSFGTHVRQ